jgi:NADPH-dependent glutamate synthase beta subunit-like oxidoreductase
MKPPDIARNIEQAQREVQNYERVYSRYLHHTCPRVLACKTCRTERIAYKALEKACERVSFDMMWQKAHPEKKKAKKEMMVAEVGNGPGQDMIDGLEKAHQKIVQELDEMEPEEPDDDF